LSACQTARALVRPGEEWFGLARTLLLAGSGAVVASQWDLDDAAAARLMGALYRRLGAGEALGPALSHVQADAHRDGVHPLHWAGCVRLAGPGRSETAAATRPVIPALNPTGSMVHR